MITRAGGGQLAAAELAIAAGWGHGGAGSPVMPGQGRLTERDAYTADELSEIGVAAAARREPAADLLTRLGPPVDVWLNDVAYWRTVPCAVWEFRIGGYQVIKKWLSYREAAVLGRALTTAEAREVTGNDPPPRRHRDHAAPVGCKLPEHSRQRLSVAVIHLQVNGAGGGHSSAGKMMPPRWLKELAAS